MPEIQTFNATVAPAEGRTMTARAVPFGAVIEHGSGRVVFDAGSIKVDGLVPLTVDHESGSAQRVGKLIEWREDGDAGYADFAVSETTLGSDVLTLLHDGVLTDVSVGVAIDPDAEFTDDDGVLHRAGTLDHVSIVGSGAFGNAGAGSKVLEVHNRQEPVMAEMEAEATAPAVATYEDVDKLKQEIVRLTDKIDNFDTKVVQEPELFENFKDFVLTTHHAGQGNQEAIDKLMKSDRYEMDTFAMSNDDTTTAGGLVPNFLSKRVLGLLETNRPSVEAFGKIDPGDYGMSVVLPNVTTEAAVAVQSAGGDQPNSTEMVIGTSTYALETYAGANRVNVQLIERSSPAFVDRLFESLVSSYATVTDAAFVAALVAGVGTNTAVLADLSADPTATYAAILAGVTAIAGDIKRPADRLILGSAGWGELMSNLDSEDRPLVAAFSPSNAQGVGMGSMWNFEYGLGLQGIFDPHAAAQTCLIAWSGAAASIEVPLPRLSVSKVEFASMDLGIIGLFTDAILYGGNTGGLYSLTAA